ncbi:valine--tRNA ligase [Candidatus Sumerlaeota bacterium]|nr:valine--tRNA ligase [Candidatus Sumerlaeota bacterium]
MIDLDKRYDPKATEGKWYAFWEEGGFFAPDPEAPGGPYTIVIPPPNVTGKLHTGHGLDNTLQDLLIRWHRMSGCRTLWVPGMDHAGIATQTVVEKALLAEGKRKRDMTREEFLERVWAWKEEKGGQILRQLRRLGSSCDWSREAFTMDAARSRAVRQVFKRLYDQGLLYRGLYLVNWDPGTQTALADDEVEYEEEEGHLWHIRYPFEDGSGHAVVATTRPETMLGDTAVAIHPKDDRYQHLIGKSCILPLMDRPIPFVADDFVDREFGTGMVKVTPAHDPNDFECGRRHDLEMINILTEDGHINENGGKYSGLDIMTARERVVEDLTALGLIERVEPHTHRVGRSYRSKAVVEPYLSEQWFVKMRPLAERAAEAVRSGRIRLIPRTYEGVYFHWLENVRDWCISRQLWWGHRIPIWYRRDDRSQMLCFDGEGDPPEVTADPGAWEQDPDVLDTWFSSWLWPLSTLGWPEETEDLRIHYPTSVLVTGHDILFFWVARMIMAGLFCRDEIPFHDVYIHGLIFGKSYYRMIENRAHYLPEDEVLEIERSEKLPRGVKYKWEKMSKSKGNIIDPSEMIDEFGADAVRFTLTALCTQGRQLDLERNRFRGYRNFVNKIWNAARLVFMNMDGLRPEVFHQPLEDIRDRFALEDKWIISAFNRAVAVAERDIEDYDFSGLANNLYQFFWRQYCDWYLEYVKPRLYGDDRNARETAQIVMTRILERSLRLLHPLIPFVTEEIWQRLRDEMGPNPSGGSLLKSESIMTAQRPRWLSEWIDDNVENEIQLAQMVVDKIRNIQSEVGFSPSDPLSICLYSLNDEKMRLLAECKHHISQFVKVESLSFTPVSSARQKHAHELIDGDVNVYVDLPEELCERELARLDKVIPQKEKLVTGLEKKLGNEGFTSGAPAEVVVAERARLAQAQSELTELLAKRRLLG